MTPKQDDTKKIIADIEKRLDKLTTIVEYEALKEITRIRGDLTDLEDELAKYATNEAIMNISKKVTKIEKNISWVIYTVLGAVILAVMQLILRKTV